MAACCLRDDSPWVEQPTALRPAEPTSIRSYGQPSLPVTCQLGAAALSAVTAALLSALILAGCLHKDA